MRRCLLPKGPQSLPNHHRPGFQRGLSMSPHRQGQQWIDDVWIDGDGSEWNRSNPYDGSRVWSGHWASESQANNAILAAHHSFQSWSVTSINDRIAIVRQFASIFESKRHILNQTIVAETGKPRWEADAQTAQRSARFKTRLMPFSIAVRP